MKIFYFIILIASLFLNIFGEKLSYNGYKVVRVESKTKDEADIVHKLESDFDFDFWREGKSSADIMGSPENFEFLENFLKENSLNYSIAINDVGSLIQENEEKNAKFADGRMNWNAYQPFQTIESWIFSLNEPYFDILTIYTGGNSYEGREMYILKISPKNSTTPKKAIWIDGNIHAREWITPAVCTYFINELLTNYEKYAELLEKVEFYIMPSQNPDGYVHTHTTDRMWRKFRQNHDPQGNCIGTDGNRNYELGWGRDDGSSGDPCNSGFRGPSPFSESETLSVFTSIYGLEANGVDWAVFFTIHSYTQLILTPWGYMQSHPPDHDELIHAGNLAKDAIASLYGTEYTVGTGYDALYPMSGNSLDWAYGTGLFNLAYLFELRDKGDYGFLLPPDQIIPCAEETWLGIMAIVNHIIE